MCAPNPQTPQAAEFLAICGAGQCALPDSSVFVSDCLNVVRLFNSSWREQLSYKRPYSGSFITLQPTGLRTVTKVKGHATEDPDMSDELKYYKRGNDAADLLAKAAATRHPAPTGAQSDKLARQLRMSKLACELAGKLLPLWPRLDRNASTYVKPPAPEKVPVVGHEWSWQGRFWQCERCFRGSRAALEPARFFLPRWSWGRHPWV